MRARFAFAVVALAAALGVAACNRAGTAAPQTWAHEIASTYYETRGDGAAVARMAQAQEVETALGGLRGALGDQRNARIGAERIGFLLEYPPIWRADHIDQAQWEARRARIPLISDADVGQWRSALGTAAGGDPQSSSPMGNPPSEMWTIGYLIDCPSLFKDNAFDQQRSSLLLERLSKLSPEATGIIAATLHIDRAWAALLIVQNDDLFRGGDIDPDKFAAASAALGEIVEPHPTTSGPNTGTAAPAAPPANRT